MNLFELAVVVSAVDRATSVLNGVKGAVDGASQAAERMQQWGQRATAAGAAVTAASGSIVNGLQSIIEPSNDIQDSLAKVESVLTPMTGTMAESLEVVKQAAIDWSSAHSDAATKFLDTTYMMISAGLDQTQSIEATRTAMLVAKATMGESTEAANLIGGAYNTMGNKARPAAEELGRLGDVVTKTQQLFQFANFAQLSEGLKNSTSAALNTGLSFEQLNTVIGTLNSNQLQGAEAGTAFKAALLNMNKASTDLKFSIAKTSSGGIDFIGTLANIEKKFGSLRDMSPKMQQAFRTAFGDEGYNAMSLLLGKSGELQKSLASVTDSAGAAEKAAAVMGATGSEGAKVLQNQVVGLKDAVATQLRPVLEGLAVPVAAIVQHLTQFAKANPEIIRLAGVLAIVLAVVAGIVGPIMMAAGAIGMFGGAVAAGWAAMTAFTGALLANPITWIVVGIVAAAILIYKYWGPIKQFFIGIWDGIKVAWGYAVAFFTGIFENIKAAFRVGLVNGIVTVLSYITPVGIFTRIFIALWPYLRSLGAQFIAAITSWAGSVWAAVAGFASGVWNRIKAEFDKGILNVLFILAKWSPAGIVAQALYYMGAAVVSFFTWLGGIIGGLAGRLWDGLKAQFSQGTMHVLGILAKWSPVGVIAQVFDAVTRWLFGFSLFEAGSKILNSLTAGIKAAAMGPVNAVTAVVQKVRNLLPFSPAKEGPLRDLNRIRLVETIAQTVRAAPLVGAMAGATAAAVAAIPAAAANVPAITIKQAPKVAPLAAIDRSPKPPGDAAAGGSGSGGETHVHFHIAGSADASTVAQLDGWAKNNAKLLHRIVKNEQEKDKRSDFS